jgi:HEXXH motif-containing protein
LISHHLIPPSALAQLAEGGGDSRTIGYLRAVQHSKHLMLLHAIARAVADTPSDSRAQAAFRAGYRLLARVQAERPEVVADMVRLPHVGGWAHDGLVRLSQGLPPDFSYLASVAAAAGLRAGIQFELDVPVRDGQVRLPGLGRLPVAAATIPGTPATAPADQDSWLRLTSDGQRLAAGTIVDVPWQDASSAGAGTPPNDQGLDGATAAWQGTPLIRAASGGQSWDVLLEAADEHLNRFSLPPEPICGADEVRRWRECIQSAWDVLARQGIWALGAIADTVRVIVPLAPHHKGEFISVTTPAAFGAIATTWPSDPVVMAETLVHEYAHLKLGALQDMMPLLKPDSSAALVYAPWREDPRPADGLLQGIYAHLAVARFWNAQRFLDDDPDDLLRAHVLYERWQPTVEATCDSLLGLEGCLTPDGERFVRTLREQGRMLETGLAPDSARDMAEEVTLDHWLTWQLRHMAVEPAGVAAAATAFLRREMVDREALPPRKIAAYTRQVGGVARSRMLDMRHLDPKRFRHLRNSGALQLSQADGLMLDGRAGEAALAYRAEILAADSPVPHSWVGLAGTACRTGPPVLREAFASGLPLLFEMHGCLTAQGVQSDPMDLAAWLA